MERVVQSGEFYRHFKNKLYQIIAVARHSETGELMIVYQALYGDFTAYVRPYEMFISEVDRVKYPDCTQTYRFEKVDLSDLSTDKAQVHSETSAESAANGLLLKFLDTDSLEEKLGILDEMKGNVSLGDIESICISLDILSRPGSVYEQLEEIRNVLMTKQRYDGGRLRDQGKSPSPVFGRNGGR